jgi:hypothetical protein
MTERHSLGVAVVLSLAALALAGCQGGSEDKTQAGSAAPGAESADALLVRVSLDAEDRDRIGLAVALLEAGMYQERIEGQAVVLDAQLAVELMANWTAAEAAARQSRAARNRAAALFDADAAGSREALESAERQAATDSAALEIARAKATIAYGNTAPWLDASRRAASLAALRDGTAVLVRASFPGEKLSEAPAELVLQGLGSRRDDQRIVVADPWFGPADPSVPGSVLLAWVSPAEGLVAGARLAATLADGDELGGVVVPASAVVLAGGSAWCYRVVEDDAFQRTAVDLGRPLGDGYFQASGFSPGDDVVVAGAGLLLAHELTGAEAED